MPAVNDLACEWSAEACPACIFCGTVTHHRFNARMLLEPSSKGFSCERQSHPPPGWAAPEQLVVAEREGYEDRLSGSRADASVQQCERQADHQVQAKGRGANGSVGSYVVLVAEEYVASAQ